MILVGPSYVVHYADRGNSLLEEGCCARVVNGNYAIDFTFERRAI